MNNFYETGESYHLCVDIYVATTVQRLSLGPRATSLATSTVDHAGHEASDDEFLHFAARDHSSADIRFGAGPGTDAAAAATPDGWLMELASPASRLSDIRTSWAQWQACRRRRWRQRQPLCGVGLPRWVQAEADGRSGCGDDSRVLAHGRCRCRWRPTAATCRQMCRTCSDRTPG